MVTGRRRRAWADQVFNNAISSGSGHLLQDLLLNAPTVDTLTAVRVLGRLDINVVITSEIEYLQIIDVGIGVVSADAMGVGISALPDPSAEGDYPSLGWLYVARQVCWQFKAGNNEQQRKDAVFEFDLGS